MQFLRYSVVASLLFAVTLIAACAPSTDYPAAIYDQSADNRQLSSTGVAAIVAANDSNGIAGLLAAGYVFDKGIDCITKGKCKKLLFHKKYEPFGPGTRCKGDPYGVNAKQSCIVERVPTDIEKSLARERAKAGFAAPPRLPKPVESERVKQVREIQKSIERQSKAGR